MIKTKRLTKLQTELLIPALRQVYLNHIVATRTHSFRDSHPVACTAPDRRFGRNNAEFMRRILSLWDRLQPLRKSGGRLRNLDSFDLAGLIFLVKTTLKKIRHGHHESWSPRLESAASRFLRRLEVERKALKRLEIKQLGSEGYENRAGIWREFIRYLKFHYLYCKCSYRPRSNVHLNRRRVIDRFLAVTTEELKSRDRPVPHNLRTIIRAHLRSVRRGRTPYIYEQLRLDPVFAASRFANYAIYEYQK